MQSRKPAKTHDEQVQLLESRGQRANEKLVTARLIRRDRAKRNFDTVPIEAPAITAISIPDSEAEEFLCQAPRRDHESTEQTGDN